MIRALPGEDIYLVHVYIPHALLIGHDPEAVFTHAKREYDDFIRIHARAMTRVTAVNMFIDPSFDPFGRHIAQVVAGIRSLS